MKNIIVIFLMVLATGMAADDTTTNSDDSTKNNTLLTLWSDVLQGQEFNHTHTESHKSVANENVEALVNGIFQPVYKVMKNSSIVQGYTDLVKSIQEYAVYLDRNYYNNNSNVATTR